MTKPPPADPTAKPLPVPLSETLAYLSFAARSVALRADEQSLVLSAVAPAG